MARVEPSARVVRRPKAVVVALLCQVVLLPLVALGLVTVFDLAPLLAVGCMLLAASPGGTTAKPLQPLRPGERRARPAGRPGAQVFAIVLVPVGIGMLVRRAWPGFAVRMDTPVRTASAILLLLVVIGAMVGDRDNIAGYVAEVGLISTIFCAISLSVGYVVPRVLGTTTREAIASGFWIGIHSSTLAIAMALTVLEVAEMAVPPAVYGVVMVFVAAAFGLVVSRSRKPRAMAGDQA